MVVFGVVSSNKTLLSVLYLISFMYDELDGRSARMLNQTNAFGAVLDMVTDSEHSCGIGADDTCVQELFLGFLAILAMDISSHWLQMYSTFLGSKTSHKDVTDSKSWLLWASYQYWIFVGYCAVGAGLLYIVLYLLPNPTGNLIEAVRMTAQENTALYFLALIAAPGCAIKQ